MARRPVGAPSKVVPGAKEIRAGEITQCQRELNQLLQRYGVSVSVTQLMQLSADGSPIYRFQLDIVDRPGA